MAAIAIATDLPEARGEPVEPLNRLTEVSTWACLLVSADERLRGRLRESTLATGWRPVECTSVEESLRQAVLQTFTLAMVDVGGEPQDRRLLDELMRALRQTASNLVVVCDRDGNPEGELWSRQHGAWMYLPSVEEQSDLERICLEAKAIAEKLRGTNATMASRR